jgi:hypothetical protein
MTSQHSAKTDSFYQIYGSNMVKTKTDSFYQIYGSNMVENLFAAKSALCKN